MKKEKAKKRVLFLKVLVVLLLILIGALLFLDNKQYFSIMHEKKEIRIKDECSLIVSQLIHQIKDEGDCRIRCRNECEIRGLIFLDSRFSANENDCNSCTCECK